MNDDFLAKLAQAERRIARGNEERGAGADDRARVIAEEVARRGDGGVTSVAADLRVSKKTISEATARARNARTALGLPYDTLERLFAVYRETLPPLSSEQWQLLFGIIGAIPIDGSWIESDTGDLLAEEIDDAEEGSDHDRRTLINACRNWSRPQALAVIDACHQGAIELLPTTST